MKGRKALNWARIDDIQNTDCKLDQPIRQVIIPLLFFVHPSSLLARYSIFHPHGERTAFSANRQDFSHCNANVKSLLDEVLRRGSGEREA